MKNWTKKKNIKKIFFEKKKKTKKLGELLQDFHSTITWKLVYINTFFYSTYIQP
jgi:hypothetical protein